MNILDTLFNKVELPQEVMEQLTYEYDTYGKRLEEVKKIIESGDEKKIKATIKVIKNTMLKLADSGPHNINSSNTAIAECAQAFVMFGKPSIDPIFEILDKQKNSQVKLFSQTIQQMCSKALAVIGDPDALPRLRKYADHIRKLPTTSGVFVMDHVNEAIKALEGRKLLMDLIEKAKHN